MPRSSILSSIDREVYQMVKKYQTANPTAELKTPLLYSFIQSSNSPLRRRPKQVVETSLDQILFLQNQPEPVEEVAMASERNNSRPINRPITSTGKVASAPGERPSKRVKRKQEVQDSIADQSYSLYDLGGLDETMARLRRLMFPLVAPQAFSQTNAPYTKGILLHGPPGCGKTALCKALAAASNLPFVEIQSPSVVSGMSGESEQNIREKFEEAKRLAPSIIFIDEIDAIAPKRESSQSQMEKRMVTQLLLSMDGLAVRSEDDKPVLVLAATNRPDSIDPALRRGGRFGHEINMVVPNEPMREDILKALTRNTQLSEDLDLKTLAKMTAGFVGADLQELVAGAWAERMEEVRKFLMQNHAMFPSTSMATIIFCKNQVFCLPSHAIYSRISIASDGKIST
ncbi:AAA-domain-containing protein [Microthyrium microscopicum]|uniref:AAA-domain-containing protein n=1 Tax=Microthyrium microscopicum TaxID=703497 RepID=A0A6A6UJJ5_9PEZI|nr:AAA-domain-containing protein [Microthyrium microscopicum]